MFQELLSAALRPDDSNGSCMKYRERNDRLARAWGGVGVVGMSSQSTSMWKSSRTFGIAMTARGVQSH